MTQPRHLRQRSPANEGLFPHKMFLSRRHPTHSHILSITNQQKSLYLAAIEMNERCIDSLSEGIAHPLKINHVIQINNWILSSQYIRRIQIILKSINQIIHCIEKSNYSFYWKIKQRRRHWIGEWNEFISGKKLFKFEFDFFRLMYPSVCFPRQTFETFSTLLFIFVH